MLGTVLLLAATAIFDPWAFYLGGKFHITPYWKGWGKLHAKSGDYLLYVLIQPDPRSSGAVPHLDTALTGFAYLCTPRGEKFSLNLHGGMRKRLNRSTDGEAINLRMDNQTWYKTAWYGTGTYDDSPRLFFSGYWRNPKLVMDDQGSIARAFRLDGSVNRLNPYGPHSPEIVSITLVPGSGSDFDTACAGSRH